MVSIPVVILCGGKGVRMGGPLAPTPKPLVEVGDRPILWHVMSIYASQGYKSFLLLLGEGGGLVEASIRELVYLEGDDQWQVDFVDTGPDTPTGGRVAQVAPLIEDDHFFLTYADGLADINLRALELFHLEHGGTATMTSVKPTSPWGIAQVESDGRVSGFSEKPLLDCWINGGFFCFDCEALSVVEQDSVLERAPLEKLAAAGELYLYRHSGFWACMDTYKDALVLNELWQRGEAPWRAVVEA